MAVSEEMLAKIMGAPDSPTGKLVALRKTPTDAPLETGVWYSDFDRVKAEADKRELPIVAMWTNGDLCGFCKRFTKNILEKPFLDWMQESKCLFWLGGSMDPEGRGGHGFTWCRGPNQTVSYFPFVAVAQTVNGKMVHGFFGSGHDYDERKQAPEGTMPTINKIKSILSSPYVEQAAPEKPAAQATKASPVNTNTSLHIRFNQSWDANKIARFQQALKDNGGHCCCQANKTPDTMCMCKAFLEKSTPGMCMCGAFEKYTVS